MQGFLHALALPVVLVIRLLEGGVVSLGRPWDWMKHLAQNAGVEVDLLEMGRVLEAVVAESVRLRWVHSLEEAPEDLDWVLVSSP